MPLSPEDVRTQLEANPPKIYEDRDVWGYLVWFVTSWSPFTQTYYEVTTAKDEAEARRVYETELVKHAEALAAYARAATRT